MTHAAGPVLQRKQQKGRRCVEKMCGSALCPTRNMTTKTSHRYFSCLISKRDENSDLTHKIRCFVHLLYGYKAKKVYLCFFENTKLWSR